MDLLPVSWANGYQRRVACILVLVSMCLPLNAIAEPTECHMDKAQEAVVTKLFSGKDHLYSLLWWTDPKSNLINARTFVINGHDSIPVFSSAAEGKAQAAGSGHEKELVGVDPGLLADILQGKQYAVLNPGGPHPIQFKTCIVKPYARRWRTVHE